MIQYVRLACFSHGYPWVRKLLNYLASCQLVLLGYSLSIFIFLIHDWVILSLDMEGLCRVKAVFSL